VGEQAGLGGLGGCAEEESQGEGEFCEWDEFYEFYEFCEWDEFCELRE
jgi:hypothetical protein